MPTLLATATTAMVVAAYFTRQTWHARLAPILVVGGAHLIYNTWAISFAKTTTAPQQTWCVFGAFLCFALGALVIQRRRYNAPPRWQEFRYSARTGPLLAGLAVSLAIFVYLIGRAGTPPALSANPDLARTTFFPNGIFSTIFVVPLKAVLTCSAICAISSKCHRRSFALLAGFSALLLALTANRGLLVGPIIIIVMYAALKLNLNFTKVVTIVGVALLAFSWYGYERAHAAYGQSYINDLTSLGYGGWRRYLYPLSSYLGGTSSTFDKTIHQFPALTPFQNGHEFFGPLLHIPSADLYLKSLFGLTFQGYGLALGAMNAFYLDWGYVGIMIGFGVGGMLLAFFYTKATANGGIWTISYLVLVANFLLANYGHPFAYLSSLLIPIVTIALFRPGRPRRLGAATQCRQEEPLLIGAISSGARQNTDASN